LKSSPATNTNSPHFHGLFIGVNRYASADISNLASAVRDASALHALFADNLGDDCRLLTDAAATTARLRAELRELQATSAENDAVVVAFSGHGSDTHELVTYDADPYNLASTALPLDELTELVSAIPAQHLLVVLDCCFSGGAGAKVLQAPVAPRGGAAGIPLSTAALLDKAGGDGPANPDSRHRRATGVGGHAAGARVPDVLLAASLARPNGDHARRSH
jgi:uncharacterized caspase-like protein